MPTDRDPPDDDRGDGDPPDDESRDANSPDDPLARNRLDEEASPYLRQHADNPVNWQPWDDIALEAARERDCPIFLSIGYAACHWCHVMAEESFADEDVAAILNEEYVPIKVDREERPDVDSVYMSICQQVTGRGGWPLSAWLTPDLEPFYVGTYFPKEPKRGMPAFPDLLEDVAETWSDPDQREDVEQRARQWAEAIESDVGVASDAGGSGDVPGAETLEMAADTAVRAADRRHGGWGGADGPKFPQPARLQLLLRAREVLGRSGDEASDGAGEASDDAGEASDGEVAVERADPGGGDAGESTDPADAYRAVAVETLDAMADGGLFDHVGGGFHRYCTDREWVVPHFEKMLYDQAELVRAFLAGHQATGDERYADVAEWTLQFVDRELSDPGGAFYSTLDARSEVPEPADGEGDTSLPLGDPGEREEGPYYVWTPETVEAAVERAVDDADLAADLFRDRYGVTDAGNFEGATVLTIERSIDSLAEEYDLSPDEVRKHVESARSAVFLAREERPRPPRDEKVLAGWNGLAISAFAEAATVLEDDAHADRASEALAFVREHLWTPPGDAAGPDEAGDGIDAGDGTDDGDRADGGDGTDDGDRADAGDGTDGETGRLRRRYKDGDVRIDGYLEDYAFLGRGALDLYQATGDVDHLAFALDLAAAVVEEFWDADDETLYFAPESDDDLVARPQELSDQSTPSSTGVAVQLLLALDPFTDDDRFESVAASVLSTHGDLIEAGPMEHATLVLAGDGYARGALELALVADERPAAWRETLAASFLPDAVLAPRPADEGAFEDWLDRLGLSSAPAIWADRDPRDGEPTVYACRRFACSPPESDLEAAIAWARREAPAGESRGR